ncbi:YceI family protein [Mucilaginibacter sp.]|jgi:polyisoprenoid-binding protein YceI|uniref:YceI family protein n=1 Tax=Mucilaginibacter sp. TaxID=1882438 RepID=UPI003568FF1B
MKKLLLLVLISGISQVSLAQYKPLELGSSLKFTIKNLGFDVGGSFSGFEGTIDFDPQNLSNSKFDVTINAATINTDNSLRDEHLKGGNYFDVKNSPHIKIASTKITPAGKGAYQFNGSLTIKGKSKPISFPFTAVLSADVYAFKGSFKMKRKDFGVGGTSTVSDELEVSINVIAKK